MTTTTDTAVYYDMYDRDIYASPYETYRRLRDESPLYYNPEYDFYCVSRFDDVLKVILDAETYISSKGMTYNVARTGVEMPPGLFIAEDPPTHTFHRTIVSRLFTPKAVAGLEGDIRRLCTEIVDDIDGLDHFDFMKDFSLHLPVQVIGMLVGVPKKDQSTLLEIFQKNLHENSANPDHDAMIMQGILDSAAWFNEYLDWREQNPSDDVMTRLMKFEFEDDQGVTRTLRRDEIVTYLTLITTAGSDTTATGISSMGALLNDHPDQRAELVADPSLIPNAVEESFRMEPPSYHFCRVTTKDTEWYGQTVPVGSIMVVLPGSANRDERKWGDDAGVFDIHRKPGQILTFSFGTHYCLGANLAKIEARIAFETILPRIPKWTVDYSKAELTKGIDTRGWEKLPVSVG
jgi:cytochrome P450